MFRFSLYWNRLYIGIIISLVDELFDAVSFSISVSAVALAEPHITVCSKNCITEICTGSMYFIVTGAPNFKLTGLSLVRVLPCCCDLNTLRLCVHRRASV